MTPPAEVAKLLAVLPAGTYRGHASGKHYVATKTVFSDGRSVKLVAEELGGPDYISMNYYALEKGDRLFPCEMPAQKVIHFLRAFVVTRG